MFINQFILSEPELYTQLIGFFDGKYKSKPDKIIEEILHQFTYRNWHRKHFNLADQHFHAHWKNLVNRKEENKGWSLALLNQASRYYFCDDVRRIKILPEKFSEWQSWIANQSGLPVIAYKIRNQLNEDGLDFSHVEFDNEITKYIESCIGYKTIVSPYFPLLEDYIHSEGLNETHMHIMGTTFLEILWMDALINPKKNLEEMRKEYNKDRVRLLYSTQNSLSSPEDYYHLLIVARVLREILILSVLNKNNELIKTKEDYLVDVINKNNLLKSENDFFYEVNYYNEIQQHKKHYKETALHIKIQDRINKSEDRQLDCYYLLYLICMNCYQRLLVQRSDQYGFDQFQKFADDGVREHYEKEFSHRFYQLHGSVNQSTNTLQNNFHNELIAGNLPLSDINLIEARFAPKATTEKNENLLASILKGFVEFSGIPEKSHNLNRLAELALINQRPKLRLIAHFIKMPWKRLNDLTKERNKEQQEIVKDIFHYNNVRDDVLKKAILLFDLMDNNASLKKIITGVDVAANELEAPPEVFSELYRYARYRGIKKFTFHVGEDFVHLVTGVRKIYEAVKYLELNNGDRIGHGTAIGIDPQYWIKNMPDNFYTTRVERLDDLLFIRELCINENLDGFNLYEIERKIKEQAKLFLTKKHIPHNIIFYEDNVNFLEKENIFLNNILDEVDDKSVKAKSYILKIKAMMNEYIDDNFIFNIDDLQSSLQYRDCNPRLFLDFLEKKQLGEFKKLDMIGKVGIVEKEYQMYNNIPTNVLPYLLLRWFSLNSAIEGETLVEVKKSEFTQAQLIKLQQCVQHIIAKKKVIIETLPTSNVRISHYNSIEQHHIFRWLKIKGREIEGDADLDVILGSDDPGIFATDIRNEIYHIFTSLIHNYNYSQHDALDVIRRLNQNSRIFSFQ